MNIGSFTLSVYPGSERGDGYVEMQHNTPYVLHLANSGSVRCDAEELKAMH